MWELDHKEGLVLKTWCFWIVLEKVLECSLDCKKIKLVNPKRNQSLIFTGWTDTELKVPILWSLDAKSWFIGKDPDAGKDWGLEEKGVMTKDKMVGWHHQLNGLEFEQTLGVGDGQRSLTCCPPWGHKEWDMAERLNWTELIVLKALKENMWNIALVLGLFLFLGALKYILGLSKTTEALNT